MQYKSEDDQKSTSVSITQDLLLLFVDVCINNWLCMQIFNQLAAKDTFISYVHTSFRTSTCVCIYQDSR